MSHKSKGLIQRYNANERTNHWITAITFVLLALSGLALFHPALRTPSRRSPRSTA